MVKRKYFSLFFIYLMIAITSNGWTNWLTSNSFKSEQEVWFIQALEEAQAKLQAGVNTWDVDLLKKGRDLFLTFFRQTKEKMHTFITMLPLLIIGWLRFIFQSITLRKQKYIFLKDRDISMKRLSSIPQWANSLLFIQFFLATKLLYIQKKA